MLLKNDSFHFSHGSVAKLTGDMGQFQTTVFKTSSEFYLKNIQIGQFLRNYMQSYIFAPQCTTSTRCMALDGIQCPTLCVTGQNALE
jgi:hypothetical protein